MSPFAFLNRLIDLLLFFPEVADVHTLFFQVLINFLSNLPLLVALHLIKNVLDILIDLILCKRTVINLHSLWFKYWNSILVYKSFNLEIELAPATLVTPSPALICFGLFVFRIFIQIVIRGRRVLNSLTSNLFSNLLRFWQEVIKV